MAALTTVAVPDIGDFTDVPVIEVLVKPGDTVQVDTPLIVLESDKATMEVPSSDAGVVSEVMVSAGATVSKGDAILTLVPAGEPVPDVAQNGKAAAEAPAPEPAAQTPDVQDVSDDSKPQVEAEETESRPAQPTQARPSAPPTPPARPASQPAARAPQPASSQQSQDAVYASPSVRRLARELGIDLNQVAGTGPHGRITRDDIAPPGDNGAAPPAGVEAPEVPEAAPQSAPAPAPAAPPAAPAGLPAWPSVDFAAFGPVEQVPLTRIQRLSGPALTRNWVMIPHVTQHDEADITDLEEFRKDINRTHAEEGVKVTMVSLLLKASSVALREFPNFNSSLEGDHLVRKGYFNLGFAADTPNGLVVPVIRDVDRKGLLQIARELAELSGAAREGKLTIEQMQGGTFTISSLGGIGGTLFTPIINAPEVAILGVSRSATKPVWNGEEFTPRLMLPLSLSYDHRVVDGAAAARFTTRLGQLLRDPRQMLL